MRAAITKICPNCGHKLVTFQHMGFPGKGWMCPMNMPYQGCGYRKWL